MSTPTLTVDGPPEAWLSPHVPRRWAEYEDGPAPTAERQWVPVESLPIVEGGKWWVEDRGGGHSEIMVEPRPLQPGDQVTLATECGECVGGEAYEHEWKRSMPCETCRGSGDHPFAAATVAEVRPVVRDGAGLVEHLDRGSVIVTEHRFTGVTLVVASKLGEKAATIPADDAWSTARHAIRLTNVEPT